MRVKSLHRDNYYDKQQRVVGDIYEVDDRDEANQKLLEKLGRIEILKDEPPQPKPAPEPEPAPPQPEQAQPQEAPPSTQVEPMTTDDGLTPPMRRTYRRRDMKAER